MTQRFFWHEIHIAKLLRKGYYSVCGKMIRYLLVEIDQSGLAQQREWATIYAKRGGFHYLMTDHINRCLMRSRITSPD